MKEMKMRWSLSILVFTVIVFHEARVLGEELSDLVYSSHLVGRWKFGSAANVSAQDSSRHGFVFFSPDGMFVSSDDQNSAASCWELVRKDNQAAIMLGRSQDNLMIVHFINTNKVSLVPTRKSDPEILLDRDQHFVKASEDLNKVYGTWKVTPKENKTEDYALITFYPQMVFIQQTPMDISGGEWKMSSKMFERRRKLLSVGDHKYEVSFSGTNLFHAMAQGKYEDLVFERHKLSELGYPRADILKRQ